MPEMNDPGQSAFRLRVSPPGTGCRTCALDIARTEDENALAAEKEKLAQQLDQLQRGMQQQAQGLQQTSPDASNKVRRALSEAEGKELALRMQKNAQWIREGYGDRNLGMEDNVTAGVEQLSRDLRGASQALNNDQGNGKGTGSDATAKALDQVRQLRDKLERAQATAQAGKQAGPGQPASPGSPAGSQPGGQPGSQPGSQPREPTRPVCLGRRRLTGYPFGERRWRASKPPGLAASHRAIVRITRTDQRPGSRTGQLPGGYARLSARLERRSRSFTGDHRTGYGGQPGAPGS